MWSTSVVVYFGLCMMGMGSEVLLVDVCVVINGEIVRCRGKNDDCAQQYQT